jgi:cell division protein FtsW (lipid II flippase)
MWSGMEVADVAVDLRAVPLIAVLGLLAIAWPRAEVEASAALAGLVAASASLDVAPDQPTALAIQLTVAGALVTLSSLIHQERRVLAWPGGALLAAATWVRLADLGVEAPEAYTLPSAVVLVLAALHRLWRTSGTDTAVLLPGLTLATVPSLLWVLADPVSLRAVLLGMACLGLVLAGAQLRWSSPLAVGGLAGGLLVLREVAPYASELPQWVLIGVAGTVLTVVGVTWEHRILELRRATAYLGRLR